MVNLVFHFFSEELLGTNQVKAIIKANVLLHGQTGHVSELNCMTSVFINSSNLHMSKVFKFSHH